MAISWPSSRAGAGANAEGVVARSTTLFVAGVTLLGGLLRFATLDAKSFWHDEALTVLGLNHHFGGMLAAIGDTEATPPLYYALAWLWSKPFGLGEIGLRSLSALVGTAVVPVVYAAGRDLVSRRAGLAAAAVAAVNPLLVWYSQEARAYSLSVLASAVAFWGFIRALDGRSHGLALWWAGSTVAILSRYLAAPAFVIEAVWLLWYRRSRGSELRPVIVASAPPLVAAVGLVPLALSQASSKLSDPAVWISSVSLPSRIVEVPGAFLVGFESPRPVLVGAIACLLVVPALWVVLRAMRRGAMPRVTPAIGVPLAGVALTLLFALAGKDYFLHRNLIDLLVPVLLVLGAGFTAAGVLGRWSLAGLCGLSLFVLVATAWQPKFDREDWRSAAAAIGPAARLRAVVATPGAEAWRPLAVYSGTRRMRKGTAVSEVAVLASARRPIGSTERPTVPRPETGTPPAPEFAQVARRTGDRWTLLLFRAARPVRLTPAILARAKLDPGSRAVVLLQEPKRNILPP